MTEFEKVVEQVKALNPAEQWRLRRWLEVWLAPPRTPPTEEEFLQILLKKGMISRMPLRNRDLANYVEPELIEIKGKPLSETIIEERR